MITQENQTDKKPGEDLTNYSQGKTNPLWKNWSFTIELRPLTSYCYIE